MAEPLPTWPLLTPAHFVSIVARSLVEHVLNADALKTRFLSKKITAWVTAKEPAGLTGPGVVAVVTFSEPTDLGFSFVPAFVLVILSASVWVPSMAEATPAIPSAAQRATTPPSNSFRMFVQSSCVVGS